MKGIKLNKSYSLRPKATTEQQQDIKLKQAAKMYEKQFLREIMKAMRSTVSPSELSKPGFAEKIYQNQLDDQYTDKWGESGGIGLTELIFQQIKNRFGTDKNINKPKGPISIEKKPLFLENKSNMFPVNSNKEGKDLSFIIPGSDQEQIANPWDGQLKAKYSQSAGQQVVEIQHDVGLSSLISFGGDLAQNINTGDFIKAGEKLGVQNSLQKNVYWKIRS